MYYLVNMAHKTDKNIKVAFPTFSMVDDKKKFIKEYGDMIHRVWGHKVVGAKKITREDYDKIVIAYGNRTPLARALDMLREDYKDNHAGWVRRFYRFWS